MNQINLRKLGIRLWLNLGLKFELKKSNSNAEVQKLSNLDKFNLKMTIFVSLKCVIWSKNGQYTPFPLTVQSGSREPPFWIR